MEVVRNLAKSDRDQRGADQGPGVRQVESGLPRFSLSPRLTPTSTKLFSDVAFLYVASGNDTAEYAEHYGNDACVLHHLHGARSLLFARSSEDAFRYQKAAEHALVRWNVLNELHYGLQLPAHYEQFDSVIWSGEIVPTTAGLSRATAETLAIAQKKGRTSHEFSRSLMDASFNQFTTIQLSHIRALLSVAPPQLSSSSSTHITETLGQVAQQALELNNKANYYSIVRDSTIELPRHVPTTIVTADWMYELVNDPQRLSKLRLRLGVADGAVIVKSALEAGGECCVILRNDSDTMPLLTLISSLREKGRELAETPCLVQKLIEPRDHYLPARIGIIGSVGDQRPFEVSTQLYADAERKTYLGSLWTAGMSGECIQNIGAHRIQNLLNEFSLRGYRGPLGLDAMLDHEGNYTMIYDANPRLTSAAAVFMVRDALRNQGIDVLSAASLGHHGNWEFPSIDATLGSLQKHNLVFSKKTGSGALIIPNWRGDNRFDVYAINMTPEKIGDVFAQLSQCSVMSPPGLHF